MSSINLQGFANKYPDEKEAIRELERLLNSPQTTSKHEFTLDRLFDIVGPSSREELAIILGELVSNDILKLVIRVESPTTSGGIGDFDKLEAVPDRIHDWRTDRRINVTAENIRVLYKVRPQAQ